MDLEKEVLSCGEVMRMPNTMWDRENQEWRDLETGERYVPNGDGNYVLAED